MSCTFRNRYWLLGDGADEEAKRWVTKDEQKTIVFSSPRAVEMAESGNYLEPELPVPQKGFVIVSLSQNESEPYSTTLGLSHWGGDGGWIEPKHRQDETGKILSEQEYLEELASHEKKKADVEATGDTSDDCWVLAEQDFLEELRRINNDN